MASCLGMKKKTKKNIKAAYGRTFSLFLTTWKPQHMGSYEHKQKHLDLFIMSASQNVLLFLVKLQLPLKLPFSACLGLSSAHWKPFIPSNNKDMESDWEWFGPQRKRLRERKLNTHRLDATSSRSSGRNKSNMFKSQVTSTFKSQASVTLLWWESSKSSHCSDPTSHMWIHTKTNTNPSFHMKHKYAHHELSMAFWEQLCQPASAL